MIIVEYSCWWYGLQGHVDEKEETREESCGGKYNTWWFLKLYNTLITQSIYRP